MLRIPHCLDNRLTCDGDDEKVQTLVIPNYLILWSWALLERPLNSFPAFHGTRRFTEFTRALHLVPVLSRTNPVHITPSHLSKIHPTYYPPTYVLVFLVVFFPCGFSTTNLCTFLFSPVRATCLALLILLYLIILIILRRGYKSRSSSLSNILHSPVTSSLFGPNILLRTLFSNTLSLCSYLSVRDQVSHPYRTTGKIIVLYRVRQASFLFRSDRSVQKRKLACRTLYI
jgi:hypothetical protein